MEDQPSRMGSRILRSYPWSTGILSHPNLSALFDSHGSQFKVRPSPLWYEVKFWSLLTEIHPASHGSWEWGVYFLRPWCNRHTAGSFLWQSDRRWPRQRLLVQGPHAPIVRNVRIIPHIGSSCTCARHSLPRFLPKADQITQLRAYRKERMLQWSWSTNFWFLTWLDFLS